jgi:hypothetical protein
MSRMASFCFDYFCTDCDAAFCERVLLINLALGFEDDAYCLDCLARIQACETPAALVMQVFGYIQARDCFKTPWNAFDAAACPRQANQQCYCQHPA